jgi:ribosomal protein S18 acetylase RimI-like enzyme
MLQLRRYRPGDNAAVKALHYAGVAQMDPAADPADDAFRDADLDDIEGHYLNGRGDFLLGFDGGELVAMGALRQKTETLGEIKRIRVRRDCQRQGYGKIIVLRLIERASALGYQELVLDTLENNPGAQRLFASCGFTENCRGMRGNYHLIFYTKRL